MACSGVPGEDGIGAGSPSSTAETPSSPDPKPAKLRVSHMWEGEEGVDVCVLEHPLVGAG